MKVTRPLNIRKVNFHRNPACVCTSILNVFCHVFLKVQNVPCFECQMPLYGIFHVIQKVATLPWDWFGLPAAIETYFTKLIFPVRKILANGK